jgi:uncharacterized protein YabE (DUF348 family)
MQTALAAKALVAAIVGIAMAGTLAGLSAATLMTSDVMLTLDGVTQVIRVRDGQTVGGVLETRKIVVAAQDLVSPDLDTTVTDGLKINVSHARAFTATIDGRMMTMTTTASTIDGALATMGIDATAADVSVPPQTLIDSAVTPITVSTQKMISLRVDGQTLYAQTTADNVRQLLADQDIVISHSDRVSPSLDTPLEDDTNVVITRVTVATLDTDVDLPYATKQVESSSLNKGETQVTTHGENGSAHQVWQVTMADGVEESRKLISQDTTRDPVTQVEEVGTRKGGGSSSSSHNTTSRTPVPSGSAQEIARQLLPSYGFSDSQFGCLVSLWNKESHWNVYAQNGSSGAYGIPQALPGSKMASVGSDWRTNPTTQIKWGLGYIKGRYGTPCSAWSHSQRYGWY